MARYSEEGQVGFPILLTAGSRKSLRQVVENQRCAVGSGIGWIRRIKYMVSSSSLRALRSPTHSRLRFAVWGLLWMARSLAATAPVPDSLYWQEVGTTVASELSLTSVVAANDRVWVGTVSGLRELRGERLEPVSAVAGRVDRLVSTPGHVWALTVSGLHRWDGRAWSQVATNQFSDLVEHQGTVVASADRRLFRLVENQLEPVKGGEAPFPIHRLSFHQEVLWVSGSDRLAPWVRGVFGGLDVYGFPADQSWDWGNPPSREIRDLLATDDRLILGTPRGLGVLRGMVMHSVRGDAGLPQEDVLCLAAGWNGDLWIGTSQGAVRQTGGGFHYFAGKRWLPDDRVVSIASGKHVVYLATPRGLGVIQYLPFTLAKKAAYYERYIEASGQKRLGLLHKLEWDDGSKEFVREAGDNDGGYSGDYLTAQSYRYAVTHDPVARREATNSFHALRFLERMTGISGFPARGIWVKNEKGHKATGGSGGYPAEWHDSKADPRFEWKGDTSSDELCSHFYAVSRFLELAAEGDEKRLAVEHLARIAEHLIVNHWQLIDLDGKPTRWGRWDPEYFLTDEGHFDRGLQALELLSFVKTAEVLTGRPLFAEAYRKLVELGYPSYTLRQRQTTPPEAILHFEDQLAFWSYWTLLKYETDPGLHATYRRSFERTYEVLRIEHQPWFNYVHAVISGVPGEEEHSATHLREWPLDLRIWNFRNSHRTDLKTPAGYVSLKGGIQAISPREGQPIRWDSWTMQLDGGSDGHDVVEPGGWLLAYWMGRYHGFIAAPSRPEDGIWTEADGPALPRLATPYDGPARPMLP